MLCRERAAAAGALEQGGIRCQEVLESVAGADAAAVAEVEAAGKWAVRSPQGRAVLASAPTAGRRRRTRPDSPAIK